MTSGKDGKIKKWDEALTLLETIELTKVMKDVTVEECGTLHKYYR